MSSTTRIRRAALAAVLPLALAGATAAQQAPAAPAARPADVESIDAIITTLYGVISGPVGQARDWDRMRSLFVPGARLIPTGSRDGAGVHALMSVEDYIARSGPMLEQIGFREIEIARTTEQFGNIAHAFSTYDSFRGDETAPFMRGINSIQLWNDGSRWWVVNVFWQQESPEHPIPQRYLPR